MKDSLYALRDPSELLSPGVLIYRSLVRQNLEAMIAMARAPSGSGRTSRPTRWPRSSGWPSRWASASTSARRSPRPRWWRRPEGPMSCSSYPLIGPNLKRFAHLVRGYRNTTFRATVDDPDSARALSAAVAGARPAGSGPGRSGDRHGPDRDRPGRGGRRALRADRPAAEPGRRRPACLRRPHPRHRPRGAAEGRPVGPGAHAGAARPAAEAWAGRPAAGGGGDADLPDPRRARDPRRGVFAGNDHASRPQLLDAVSRPAVHPGRPAADPGDQPTRGPAGSASTWATRPSPPTRPARAPGSSSIDDARPVVHSEEHLVIETAQADEYPDRDAAPRDPDAHLPDRRAHRRAYVIEDGELVGQWEVTARDRVLGL